jgi:hypothetical protein
MGKRASLFTSKAKTAEIVSLSSAPAADPGVVRTTKRAPSREGKRILSVYLDPLAWKQLWQLALDETTTTQALGEEAINLLFAKHGLNRSA